MLSCVTETSQYSSCTIGRTIESGQSGRTRPTVRVDIFFFVCWELGTDLRTVELQIHLPKATLTCIDYVYLVAGLHLQIRTSGKPCGNEHQAVLWTWAMCCNKGAARLLWL